METVFAKELLLETILENLGPGDLKVARRVNKQWNYRATRILLAKQLLTVTHAFQHSPNVKDKHAQKLLSLETTINESPLFPSCSFALSNCNLPSPDAQHLLETFGHLIHTLNISLDKRNLPGATGRAFQQSFKNMLFVQLPNLEKLTLKSRTPSIWKTEVSEGDEGTIFSWSGSNLNFLPKLKCLRVESVLPENVFEFFTQAGVNLEEVELFHYYHEKLLEVLRRTDKMHLLTTAMTLLRSDNLDLIDHFANAQLKIKKLYLFVCGTLLERANIWLEATTTMTTLLQANAHSLEVIQIPPLFFLPQFDLPIMPRLENLIIFVLQNICQGFPPKIFKMSKVFPRLLRIFTQYLPGLASDAWSKEMFEDNFLGGDYQDSVSTVAFLQFEREPEFSCIQKLPLLFPNIKKIVILNLTRISRVLNVLWDLPKLVALDFGVSIETLENLQNASWNTNAFTALDSALTGICEETCAHLSSSSEILDAATLKQLRLKKSMVDAKCLAYLRLIINDDSTEKRTSPTKAVFSKIALQYAFEMCSGVKVEIILNGKKEENAKYLLDGVSPVLSSSVKIKKEKKNFPRRETIYVYTLTL